MTDSLQWLAQSPEGCSFADITFVREGLALSNLKAPNDPFLLRTHGIRSILSLFKPGEDDLDLSEASDGWADATSLRKVRSFTGIGEVPHPELLAVGIEKRIIHPLKDDATNSSTELNRAIEILAQLHLQFAPVLVHCRLGASRTPAIVGCYLAKREGLSFREVVNEIAKLRPISIEEGLARTLVEACGIRLT